MDDYNFQIQIVGVDLKMEDSRNLVAAHVNKSKEHLHLQRNA